MYRREKSMALRGSSSALYNNLSVLLPPRGPLAFLGSVHGPAVTVLSATGDAAGRAQRQLQARAGGGASLVTQAAWCVLPARTLLVLTCQKGIQMYESDGSIMVYWHALDIAEPPPAQAAFARGISAAGERFICVGLSSGMVLVFDIPPKGTDIAVSEVLKEHRDAITDIAAELGQAPAAFCRCPSLGPGWPDCGEAKCCGRDRLDGDEEPRPFCTKSACESVTDCQRMACDTSGCQGTKEPLKAKEQACNRSEQKWRRINGQQKARCHHEGAAGTGPPERGARGARPRPTLLHGDPEGRRAAVLPGARGGGEAEGSAAPGAPGGRAASPARPQQRGGGVSPSPAAR
ncbi:WD repeat-containing protein 54 isoform X1 [Lagopus leucura]|uniref:WD repeat-containing protein 54 isoform X1 n=1 Tax=Lagopus leucura TaxID=30410 RepID=UPI001C67AE3B|nr:WD repeat-containing protein 54 isoform X1 [Lagopus leucura]